MGLADRIRIMFGNLTPGEIEERDAAAKLRVAEAERKAEARRMAELAKSEQRDDHSELLERAGGIASLELQCHIDTWSFVQSWMDQDRRPYHWFNHTDRVTRYEGGLVGVRLSGLQVAEVMQRMAWAAGGIGGVGHPSYVLFPGDTDRAVAYRIYNAIALVLEQIDADRPTDSPVPPAVLDDRPGLRQVGDADEPDGAPAP